MDYVLTKHADDALHKRKIPLAWLEHAILNPEAVEPDPVDVELEHCIARISEYGDRVLRVILNTRKSPARVVTVYFDRRRSLP